MKTPKKAYLTHELINVAETMDQVKQILKDHILYLESIESHCLKVVKSIKIRKTQIQVIYVSPGALLFS